MRIDSSVIPVEIVRRINIANENAKENLKTIMRYFKRTSPNVKAKNYRNLLIEELLLFFPETCGYSGETYVDYIFCLSDQFRLMVLPIQDALYRKTKKRTAYEDYDTYLMPEFDPNKEFEGKIRLQLIFDIEDVDHVQLYMRSEDDLWKLPNFHQDPVAENLNIVKEVSGFTSISAKEKYK